MAMEHLTDMEHMISDMNEIFNANVFNRLLLSRLPPPPFPHLPVISQVININHTMDYKEFAMEFGKLCAIYKDGHNTFVYLCAMARMAADFVKVGDEIEMIKRNNFVLSQLIGLPNYDKIYEAFPVATRIVDVFRKMLYVKATADEFLHFLPQFKRFLATSSSNQFHTDWSLNVRNLKWTMDERQLISKVKRTLKHTMKEVLSSKNFTWWSDTDKHNIMIELLMEFYMGI